MNTTRTSPGGFTLVELIVVMAIVVALTGIGIVAIPAMMRSGKVQTVETVLLQISAAIEAYADNPDNGDFPPTVLDTDTLPGVGVRRNDTNMGIESVMICLRRPNTSTSFDIEDVPWPDAEVNLDQDRTQVGLTDMGRNDRQLWELVDPWGTPMAYFHHRDYDRIESRNLGRVTGSGDIIKAKPWKSKKGRWFRRNGFQLISAGADLEFNTDDDVTNFQR